MILNEDKVSCLGSKETFIVLARLTPRNILRNANSVDLGDNETLSDFSEKV